MPDTADETIAEQLVKENIQRIAKKDTRDLNVLPPLYNVLLLFIYTKFTPYNLLRNQSMIKNTKKVYQVLNKKKTILF